jgi:DNA repair protein RecN (Recombination protein N)
MVRNPSPGPRPAYHLLMLRELTVKNLAVIEDVRVELNAGFCAWTGETGAGKSLLLGALGLLLGERGSADLIRTGAEELRVAGRFEFARPEQKAAAEAILNDTFAEDGLVIARRLSRTGRSTALVNEQPVSIATLKKLGEMLVDVHGQRESYSLLQPAFQLELLDAFGKLAEPRAKYVASAEKVRELRRRHRELSEARQVRQRELSIVRFERDELDSAKLITGEFATLQKEREKLIHAQSLAACTSNAANRLYDDDGSVLETLGKLLKDAHHWQKYDDRLAAIANRIEALRPEVQDLAEACRDLSEKYEANPERLDGIERRLQFLKKLETKYGRSADELIAYRESLEEKESALRKQEDDLARVESELRPAFTDMNSLAAKLSTLRGKVARKLASETQKQLADLQMGNAKLDVELQSTPPGDDPLIGDVSATGIDQMDILLTANPGEPARPLRKVASGGELSRTMLALKTVLAAHDPVRTLVVFDEIDANVGGRLGDVLGRKLAALGGTHQVLCVTHLPQVASYAAAHWSIRKQTIGKRTTTTINALEDEESRVEELAMMLRGESRSATTRREAAEMLKTAKQAETRHEKARRDTKS